MLFLFSVHRVPIATIAGSVEAHRRLDETSNQSELTRQEPEAHERKPTTYTQLMNTIHQPHESV